MQPKKLFSFKAKMRAVWHFLWYEDSLLSWIANIVLAFVLIKFVVYPLLAFILGSSLPVVAVVSGSMEHYASEQCTNIFADGMCADSVALYTICGQRFPKNQFLNATAFFDACGSWYQTQHNITRDQFFTFDFQNGFNAGDVMIIHGEKPQNVQVGEVIVFFGTDGIPIIHRVMATRLENETYYFTTKGDHNQDSIRLGAHSEIAIPQNRYVGTAVGRIPYLGQVKLLALKAVLWVRSFF
jgi:signal peptidase I